MPVPPSPSGSFGSTGIPFLTPVPPAVGGPPTFNAYGIASTIFHVTLSSPNGMQSFGQTDTISVPVVCFWNNENGYSGLTFYGWQATSTFDSSLGTPGIPDVRTGLFTGSVFATGQFPDIRTYLASGNSRVRNDWDYQLSSGPQPAAGYAPIFSDLPNVRQLAVGVNIQPLPTGLQSPLNVKLANTSGFNAFGSDAWYFQGLSAAPLVPAPPGFAYTLADNYYQVTITVVEFPDMTQSWGSQGKALAQSPAIVPCSCKVDLDPSHINSYLPIPIAGPGVIDQVNLDTSWMDSLTQPFIVQSGEYPQVGQVYLGAELGYTYVPNGYYSGGTFDNDQWACPGGYLLNFLPCGYGVNYFIPRTIAFADSPLSVSNLTRTQPATQTKFGSNTLNPPGVVYGESLPGPPFGDGPATATTIALVNAFGPTNQYASPSTGRFKTIIMMDVPMSGANPYHLYLTATSTTGTGTDASNPLTRWWTFGDGTIPP